METAHAKAGAEVGTRLACSRSNSKWSVWLEHMSMGASGRIGYQEGTGWNQVTYSLVGHCKHIAFEISRVWYTRLVV